MDYRVAIVTGASSGIGQSIATQLCAQGVKVYAMARNKPRMINIQQELPKKTRQLFVPIRCDVSSKSSVTKAFNKIAVTDKVDLVISNAGIGFNGHFIDYSDAQIAEVINTNLCGAVFVIRTALGRHTGAGKLQIVVVTSLAGKIGFDGLSIYSATKFGLEGLVEALCTEYRGTNISFTILRPGITNTDFFRKAGMKQYQEQAKTYRSWFSPETVAKKFIAKLEWDKRTIVVGNDRIFLALLPFIPFHLRFKVLNLINKL